MKPQMSSLNPYAESYIPLSQREANTEKKSSAMAKDDSISYTSTAADSKDPQMSSTGSDESFHFNVSGIEELLIGEDSRKDQQNLGDHTEKQYIDDDFDMDVAYLASIFPSVSEQSLAGVYSANGGDLDASVDMLSQLELYPVDVSQHLPDTLDIGDVSDVKSPVRSSPKKQKSIETKEAVGSSSCS